MSKIIDVNVAEQYVKDYKEYALYVNRYRMIPEFRDGLKPVQRRIVYAAKTEIIMIRDETGISSIICFPPVYYFLK